MSDCLSRCSGVLLPVLLVCPAVAQERPAVAPLRCPPGEAPRIDGILADGVWSRAPALGALTQVLPSEGSSPTRRTVVRLCYDADHLYVGLHCFDEPRWIRAHLMARDANLDPDDRVEVWVDTFANESFGYWFQIGPGGSKGDALLSDGGRRFNKSWDGVFRAKSRIVDDGWTAEIALPFKTMAFDPEVGQWGFNLRRLRKESREEMRWAGPRNVYRFFDLDRGGWLTGMKGMRQGLGLDVTPYVKAAAKRDRLQRSHFVRTGDFGGDVRYRLTPQLGLLLTYRTDFAETEVDSRQVNLTRFPLFFPEKRDFFLADADLFEFGSPDRSGTMLPFFSRRIGLDANGDPLTLLGGTKLAGRIDGWNLGALLTVTEEQEAVDERTLGVLRASKQLGEQWTLGGIVTSGRPTAEGDASTFGLDFKFGGDALLGEGSNFDVWGYYVRSTLEGPGGEGAAYGVQADYRTREFDWTTSFHSVDEGFSPELGFVRRKDIRQYRSAPNYTWWLEGDVVQRLRFRVAPTLTTDAAGEVDSWALPVRWFGAVLQSGDTVQFETHRIHERLPGDFEIRPSIVVPGGDYTMTRHFASFGFSDARPLSGSVGLEYGDFYDGTIRQTTVSPQLIASAYWRVSGTYRHIDVELNGGDFRTEVYELRAEATLSPEVAWRNLLQYDTESKSLAWQSRLRWTLEPGSDLFLLGTFGWDRAGGSGLRPDPPLVPGTQEVTLKLVYLFRF